MKIQTWDTTGGTFDWSISAWRWRDKTEIETINQETVYTRSFSKHQGGEKKRWRLHHDNGSWAGKRCSVVFAGPWRTNLGANMQGPKLMPCMILDDKNRHDVTLSFAAAAQGKRRLTADKYSIWEQRLDGQPAESF
jgi:hypothetical protein